jgi:dephospho-CoA kinase
MKGIGLSGGICSGKSSVTQICQDLGGYIINADLLGHQAYVPGTDCFHELVNEFGQEIVASDGSINRRALGGIVFSDESKMKVLNQIVWPRIRSLIEIELRQLRERGVEIVVLEAAILIEAGWQDIVDEIWVIDTDRLISFSSYLFTLSRSLVIERLMSRNGLSLEDCEKRVSSQMSSEERKRSAHRVITNSGSMEELRNQVQANWMSLSESKDASSQLT